MHLGESKQIKPPQKNGDIGEMPWCYSMRKP